jgi:hypothetical protein
MSNKNPIMMMANISSKRATGGDCPVYENFESTCRRALRAEKPSDEAF